MTGTETTGACVRCGQDRPLTRYQVDHMHLTEPDSWDCPFCIRWPKPSLCAECTVVERAEEKAYLASTPRSLGEQRAAAWLRASAALEIRGRAS